MIKNILDSTFKKVVFIEFMNEFIFNIWVYLDTNKCTQNTIDNIVLNANFEESSIVNEKVSYDAI